MEVCQSFTANAWKSDLCSNCQKHQAEHKNEPAPIMTASKEVRAQALWSFLSFGAGVPSINSAHCSIWHSSTQSKLCSCAQKGDRSCWNIRTVRYNTLLVLRNSNSRCVQYPSHAGYWDISCPLLYLTILSILFYLFIQDPVPKRRNEYNMGMHSQIVTIYTLELRPSPLFFIALCVHLPILLSSPLKPEACSGAVGARTYARSSYL